MTYLYLYLIHLGPPSLLPSLPVISSVGRSWMGRVVMVDKDEEGARFGCKGHGRQLIDRRSVKNKSTRLRSRALYKLLEFLRISLEVENDIFNGLKV
jgi:hypothetical protein